MSTNNMWYTDWMQFNGKKIRFQRWCKTSQYLNVHTRHWVWKLNKIRILPLSKISCNTILINTYNEGRCDKRFQQVRHNMAKVITNSIRAFCDIDSVCLMKYSLKIDMLAVEFLDIFLMLSIPCMVKCDKDDLVHQHINRSSSVHRTTEYK